MAAVSGLSALLLGAMLAVALLNLLAAPRLGRAGTPRRSPAVSVLVPARNEAVNLEATLPALLATRYPDVEILVLDDRSTDGTGAAARRLASAAADRGVEARVIAGEPLPDAWVGKSWACHQLSRQARGEVLIFCDADVTVHPEAVARTIATMERFAAAALTALPRQRTDGPVASAVVPLVTQLPVLSLLPLPLVHRLHSPALSMANGQWIVFTRTAYASVGGHAAVRGSVLEDVELGRRVKAAGERLVVAIAADLLEVRMYRDAAAVREGFARNLHQLTGRSTGARLLGLVVFLLVAVHPWLGAAAGAAGAGIGLALLGAVRLVGVALLRHDLRQVLLHPPGAVLVLWIAVASWIGARRGTLTWKGRALPPFHPPNTDPREGT